MPEPLKNQYNQDFILKLYNLTYELCPWVDKNEFINSALKDDWQTLELKQRMSRMAQTLYDQIDRPYEQSMDYIDEIGGKFGDLTAMFFPEIVSTFGLDHWQRSMKSLAWLTRFSSSEFAVRYFIKKDAEKMMAQMKIWATDENEHVRRLASEGCRPRLPWSFAISAFKKDPVWPLAIIELVKNDDSLYVRRSAANNLNDICKDHPQALLDFAAKNIGQSENLDWLIKHACRTLLKQANPEVLQLFGFQSADHLAVNSFNCSDTLNIGENLMFDCQFSGVENQALGKLRVEYIIDYVKSNGAVKPKVFHWAKGDYKEHSLLLSSKQSFKNMSTRKHYAGIHGISIRINGKILATKKFKVES